MSASIQIRTGKTTGGSANERLALTLCHFASGLFVRTGFHGFGRVTKLVCKLLNVTERQWFELGNGLKFSVDLTDPYWIRIISPKFEYEPEIVCLLKKMQQFDYSFIDCGANMGYWSCVVGSGVYGKHSAYAVEPLSSNYQLLKNHAEQNKADVYIYKNAISDAEGQDVPLFKPGSHASVSIVSTPGDAKPEEIVQTITLDTIFQQKLANEDNIFIKLDVEGVEIRALQGGKALLENKKPLIIYEDHGEDKASTVSKFILEELGYEVLFISEQLVCSKINNLEQVNRIKTISNIGYNFIAYHPESEFAKSVIEQLDCQ